MYCSKCGMDNDDRAPLCSSCGSPLTGEAPIWTGTSGAPKPDNYLVWSILATLFCCLFPGVVAIVYATRVDARYAAGDYAGAQAAAASAKTWTLVAVGLGLATIALSVLLPALFGGFVGARRAY